MTKSNLLTVASSFLILTGVTSNAQPFARGSFNGWGQTAMTDDGDGTYSATFNGLTPDSAQEFKIDVTFDPDNWDGAQPVNNAKTFADSSGNMTVHWAPGPIADGWLPAANRVGFDDPLVHGWEIIGGFNNWDQAQPANAQMSDLGSGLYSVDYTITNAGTYSFKFRRPGTWDNQYGTDSFSGGGDLSVTTTQANQVVKFQLNLPDGTYQTGEPATNMVTFLVNMEVPIDAGIANPTAPDIFRPGVDQLYVKGSFNGFGISPTYELFQVGSSDIYSNTVEVIAYPQSEISYLFSGDPLPGDETPLKTCGANRTLLLTNSTMTAPLAYWSDRTLNDPTNLVTFVVDMSVQEAVGLFDDSNAVYVRGSFNGWLNDTFPDAAWQLQQVGSSLVYSNTFEIVEPVEANSCTKSYKFFGDSIPDYETINNREFTITGAFTELPLVFFNNISNACPLVQGETNWISFTVDMTDAVSVWETNVYDGSWDVYLNGQFLGWKGWNTNDLAAYKMAKSGDTYSIEVPLAPGADIRMNYKYGAYIPAIDNGDLDNEAAMDVNHVRYIRTTPGTTNYAVADLWTGTNQMHLATLVEDELLLGVAAAGAGSVQIDYWGVPCAELQSTTNISGPWTTMGDAVDVGSTNVSSSGTGQAYFRLIKP